MVMRNQARNWRVASPFPEVYWRVRWEASPVDGELATMVVYKESQASAVDNTCAETRTTSHSTE